VRTRDPLPLEVDSVTLRFGGVTALDDLSFAVAPGELLAIIGPNGAGKTSAINCLTGAYRPQQGRIALGEHDLAGARGHAARLGVSRTFQNLGLFASMTVIENLLIGRHLLMRTGFLAGAVWLGRARREELEHRGAVEEVIEFLELEAYRHERVEVLPYGIQKRVELGRALATEPRLLLLDEPATGMNYEETADMARYVVEFRERFELSAILVEHDIKLVMDLADRVLVLDFGKQLALGTPAEVQADERVIEAYLGTGTDQAPAGDRSSEEAPA
jgi:branched-chain amino acid transport system ATP-binding protein